MGEVIISEVPLFDGNTEAEKSRQVPRVGCFGECREFGSNDFLSIYPQKDKGPRDGGYGYHQPFLVRNPEVNYKPSFATVTGWGGRSKQWWNYVHRERGLRVVAYSANLQPVFSP